MQPKQVKLFIYLFGLLIAITACQPQLLPKPKVEKGILDLRLWHFETQGNVDLSGEWRLYWAQLLSQNAPDSGFIYQLTPQMWNGSLWGYKSLPGHGYATYRLKVIIGNQYKNKRLGIKLNYVNTSCAVFVEGERLGEIGVLATQSTDYEANLNPSVYTFDCEKDTVEVMIQVANYQDRFGGIVGNMRLGTEQQIRDEHQAKTNYVFFMIGILLIMGLYHLSFFFFRRQNLAALYFGLVCLVIAMRMLVTDEFVITDLYPAIPFQLSTKISFLSFYWAVILFPYFFHTVYPQDFSKRVCQVIGIVGLIYSVITIFTDLSFYTQLLTAFQLFTLAFILYAFYFIGLILWKKRNGSIIFTIGVLCIIAAAINDILHANEVIETFIATPLGLLLFIFSQTLLLSSLFSKAYKSVEDLSQELATINANLEGTVKTRTLEIKTTNEELNQTLEELHQNLEVVNLQRTELSEKNVEITSSLNYARRIQQTILPQASLIESVFPDSFVLFLPRDIVSGDFYWFSNTSKNILVAADCTGHGVPGAFMTMIGNQLLYEIIENRQITEANQILSYLHTSVRKIMKQDATGSREGMDLALVIIDQENKKMEFAGAKNPIVYIQNEQLHYIKGDRISIGGEAHDQHQSFNKHIIDISVPTTFYLFSDGYQDQFGGAQNKKFMLNKMKKLFLEIHTQEMSTQKTILENRLKEWIEEGRERQIDDILVIGCALK